MILWHLFLLIISSVEVVDAAFVITRSENRHFIRHDSCTRLFGEANDIANSEQKVPSFVQSPVLQKAYPAMIAHMENYGNPNIPLGNPDGKRCQTLRRLAFQKKLIDEEINLLTEMGFRFNTLEEVYEEADFDDCLQRLVEYENEFQTKFQIPKKYNPDPELGAWVTMIRRLGRDNIEASRREKLDEINFAWVSTRKCGSSFMKNYRSLKERVYACCDESNQEVIDPVGLDAVLTDADVKKWIDAQREAATLGNLSEPRCEYLDKLPGFDWRQPS